MKDKYNVVDIFEHKRVLYELRGCYLLQILSLFFVILVFMTFLFFDIPFLLFFLDVLVIYSSISCIFDCFFKCQDIKEKIDICDSCVQMYDENDDLEKDGVI